MNNNWLPGSSLTMVIISQPKSTGSRQIRDTSVLLFMIHLELSFILSSFLMWKPIYSDIQAWSLVSGRHVSFIPHHLWLLKTREEKVPNQLDRKVWVQAESSFKGFESRSLCNFILLWPSIFRALPYHPHSHHAPALGSCFPAAVVAHLRLERGK